MNYEIIYGDGALDRLFALIDAIPAAEEFLDKVEQQLKLRADDPLRWGIKDRSIFGFRGQTFKFVIEHEGKSYFFASRFYFRENENELMMVDVEVSF